MKLSDFILLDIAEKQMSVLHEGILIGKRTNEDCLIFLFRMDAFYAEMHCNLKHKRVDEFRVSDETGLLHPYLETISIDELLQ
jgi:hypothetical protein